MGQQKPSNNGIRDLNQPGLDFAPNQSTFDKPVARLIRMPDGTEPARRMSIDLSKKGQVVRVLRDLPPAS